MELREYLIPLRKWWWLLVATTVVSTVSAFFATTLQEPLYQTKATLMIGQAIEDPNPDSYNIYLTQQLAQSYVEIARRQPVRDATMAELGLTWLPEYRVGAVANTQLLEITVIDSSPERAQAVANTLAEQLIAESPTSTQQEDQARQAFVTRQLDDLEADITATEEEIGRLQATIGEMISARQIADTQAQINTLESKRITLQTNYTNLLANTREGATNTLRVIEPAPLPGGAINANRLNTILLGAAIGLLLSGGAAYLMEYLDNTLKTPEEITRTLGLPIVGYIGETPGKVEESGAIVAQKPRSPTAEAFRTLRTNLEFAAVDRPLRTILITSADPSDGKTTVATNLAFSLAQAGKHVMLIDGDLRRPRVHKFLHLPNEAGLSDLFRGHLTLQDVVQGGPYNKDVAVITSGDLPPNPAELLASERMTRILEEAQSFADVVIVDSPPFVVSDPSVLAARTDGVLLVMRPGRTTGAGAKATLEQLQRAGARVVGIVLNRIPRRGAGYYGAYRYYTAPYYATEYLASKGHSENGHEDDFEEAVRTAARLERRLEGEDGGGRGG